MQKLLNVTVIQCINSAVNSIAVTTITKLCMWRGLLNVSCLEDLVRALEVTIHVLTVWVYNIVIESLISVKTFIEIYPRIHLRCISLLLIGLLFWSFLLNITISILKFNLSMKYFGIKLSQRWNIKPHQQILYLTAGTVLLQIIHAEIKFIIFIALSS